MASGLVALLDDVAAIAKLAAASLDDIAGAAGKAGSKAAGVVIDDTAVTPRYVVGFTPDRELPIIAKIALGSVRNKLLFLLPAALALSAVAPWGVTPLLMMGGAYLCFEAAEKLAETLSGHDGHAEAGVATPADPIALEAEKVAGAIRTDFILSAEIMAITLADIADRSLPVQAIVLAAVGLFITAGVYGAVALIVKMDDIGLHLAKGGIATLRMVGRGLVRGMPVLLRLLAAVGTAAMLWVGGGIVVHAVDGYGLTTIPRLIHHAAEQAGDAVPAGSGVVAWLVGAIGSAIVGLAIGAALVGVMTIVHRVRRPGADRTAPDPGPDHAHDPIT